MRSNPRNFELIALPTMSATLERMARAPGEWLPFAGGTDLMVLFEAGKLPHRKFLSLWHLPELRGIEVAAEFVTIGALTTYTEILHNQLLQKEFALLCQAARETGGVATQNRGTLGGNIANASPAADSPPALLVYDAEIELVSAAGARRMPYAEFHTDYKKTKMRADEIIRAVRLPRRNTNAREYYRKVGTRKAQAISKVCMAARVEMNGTAIRDARVALGSIAPTVIRCIQTENALRASASIAQVRETLRREIAPIDDIRSTARYRSRVAENLLEQFLLEAGLR